MTRLMIISASLIAASAAVAVAQTPVPNPAPPPREMVLRDAMRAEQDAMWAARGADPLARYLFPPELVMQRQRDLNLQPAQRQQITQAVQRLQASLVELQWNLQEQQQALGELLAQPQVDSAAALRAMDRLMNTEAAVKRTHLAALVQIKNALTPEQQARLSEHHWPSPVRE